MAFPQTPAVSTVELYLDGRWVDVSSDVAADPGIDITVGRPNEASAPAPSSCSLTLDNRAGDYSPRNPTGRWYGAIGRNTPIKVCYGHVRDTFDREVTGGLGSAPGGGTWYLAYLAAADWSVTGGHANVSIDHTTRAVYLTDRSYGDVDVAVTATLDVAAVTGDLIFFAGLMLRWQAADDFLLVAPAIYPDQTIFLQLYRRDPDAGFVRINLLDGTGDTGLVYQPGVGFRVRAQIEGQIMRATMWRVDAGEPHGWQLTATIPTDTVLLNPGFVGMWMQIPATNTNTTPVVIGYEDFVARSVRFTGEVSAWPQRAHISGRYLSVPIEAAGVSRRLGQGQPPQTSTLRRGVLALDPPAVAYWPCEDGPTSTAAASGLGGPPLFAYGTIKFAQYTDLPASAALPVLSKSTLIGSIPDYPDTGEVQLRYVVVFPDSGLPDDWPITALFVGGTAPKWEIKYHTGGALGIEVWWTADGQIYDSGTYAFTVDSTTLMFSLELTQNGNDIDWQFETLELGATQGFLINGTLSFRRISRARRLIIDQYKKMQSLTIGHVQVRDTITDLFELSTEFNAFAGEQALFRMYRLCRQNQIPFGWITSGALTTYVGPQRVETLTALLAEAADVDGGTLYDARGDLGLMYRTRVGTYNQNNTLVADYAAGQVAPPLDPTDDDRNTRNDVTVTRRDGGSARAQLLSGSMSVAPPAAGGVGRYATQYTVNVAADRLLDDIAGWRLHLGTVNETRYPRVRINRADPDVATDPRLPTAALDLTVDDRFAITNPDPRLSRDDIIQIARGYSEHLSNFVHTITVNAAPASPYEVIRVSGGGAYPSKLGTSGSELDAGVGQAATSLLVATADPGSRWTTDPAQTPISITIGGEVMTVTGVTGGASPQTFTVIRAVNGVVKSHPAGAAVVLTHPPTLAL